MTRARTQGSELADRLAGLGATVVELPVIAIEDPDDGGAAMAAAADRLVSGSYQWVACTSSNAVSRLLAALGDRAVPASVRWAAVGPGTARRLADGGYPPELVPGTSVSDALAAVFPGAAGTGTVLFPRAAEVRGALASGLAAKGWVVDEVVAYRTVAGDPGPDRVAAAGRADAIAFTSSSTVDRAVELLGPAGVPPVVASIGPVTSRSARASGLRVTAEASPHTIAGLVDAVVQALVGNGKQQQEQQQEQQQQ